MERGKVVSRSVKITDNVKPQGLPIGDQIRLILSKFSNDDVAELAASEKLTSANLKKISSLSVFFDTAVTRMLEKHETSVTVKLSSQYLPFIDQVTDKEYGKGRFYDFDVHRQNVPEGMDHFFIVKISKKD